MNQHNTKSERVAAAWEEAKQLLRSIAPSHNSALDLPGIGFGYAFRLCRDYNIDDSGLQAICVKHGLDPQEYIPARVPKPTDIKIGCSLNVASLLNHIHHGEVYPALHEHAGLMGSPLGLPSGDWQFHYSYRQHDGRGIRTHQLNEATTGLDIAKFAALDFEDVYGVKDPETGTAAVKKPPFYPNGVVMVNRWPGTTEKTALSDPWLEIITIDPQDKSIGFFFGT